MPLASGDMTISGLEESDSVRSICRIIYRQMGVRRKVLFVVTRVKVPKRVVARRTKNYRAVHRPSRWGNPFPVDKYGRTESLKRYEKWLDLKLRDDPQFLEPLRGYNLGCFCSHRVPCHADTILRRLYGDRKS